MRRAALLVLLLLGLSPTAGAGSDVILAGCVGSTCDSTLSNSAVNYFPARGAIAATANESAAIQVTFPLAGTAKAMVCKLEGTAGSGKTYTFMFRLNAADTSLACAISGTSQTVCRIQGQSVPLAAGDVVTFQSTPSGTPSVRGVSCSVIVTPS